MADLWAGIVDLWHAGGFVMPWLVGSALVLWWAVGERALCLRRGVIEAATERALALPPSDRTPGRIREAVAPWYDELERHRVLIQSLAGTAPLVGLLGTVAGMIETFDALTTMSMHSSTGGIAGGISAALVSTQMGLAVAIPGMLAARFLENRQHRLEDELDTLPDVLEARALEAA